MGTLRAHFYLKYQPYIRGKKEDERRITSYQTVKNKVWEGHLSLYSQSN